MRYSLRLVLIGGLVLVAQAEAREWTSSDGRYTVQAELLVVDGDQAVLQREDGTVIRVPLNRLSLADVKYVQEALAAAGIAIEAHPSPASPPPPPAESPGFQPVPVPAGRAPPLANPRSNRWQVSPDPASWQYGLAADASLEIPLTDRPPFVLFPTMPSPFVVLGEEADEGPRKLWDLRRGEAVAEIDGKIENDDKLALSPSGEFLAVHGFSESGELQIWSFVTGNVVRDIPVSWDHLDTDFLEFLGSDRVIIANDDDHIYTVYDVRSGERSGQIEIGPDDDTRKSAVSPGGNYLAVYVAERTEIVIYDTRNGVPAGRIATGLPTFSRADGLAFAPSGKELALWSTSGSEMTLLAWEIAQGKPVAKYQFPDEFDEPIWRLECSDSVLQWLPDGSGWLVNGSAVVDRKSGKITWKDEEALKEHDDLLPRRMVSADQILMFPAGKRTHTLRLVSLRANTNLDAATVAGANRPSTTMDTSKARLEVKSGPPLANSQNKRWQVHVDPSPLGFGILPGASVEIPIEVSHSRPFVLYPSAPSPFVVLGSQRSRGARQLWDLRTGEMTGEVHVEISGEGIALSPDGKLVACTGSRSRGEVRIWSFATGEVVQTLELPNRHTSLTLFDFAGPDRFVAGNVLEDEFLVYDIASGERIATIEFDGIDRESPALSPGGAYLAVYDSDEEMISICDTRNGVRAGRIESNMERTSNALCLAFSPDGKSLAGVFRGLEHELVVWDMSRGTQVTRLRFGEETDSEIWINGYCGRMLEWLSGGNGWVLNGAVVIDRKSGKIVWRDEEAISDFNDVVPRRMIDGDRMLQFRKGEKGQTLCLVPLPSSKIAESRRIVAAGGRADDAGLPPVTEASLGSVRDELPVATSWRYVPAPRSLPPEAASRNRLPLGPGVIGQDRVFFSRPDAARVAICNKADTSDQMPMPSDKLPQICRLHDLRTGELVAEFTAPFATELIDLGPEGRLGLFRSSPSQDRLDVFDLTSGQHVFGFRPFVGTESRDRKVADAHLIDENHAVAVSEAHKLIAWEIPNCRALFAVPQEQGRLLALTRDRQNLVLDGKGTPFLVNSLSGEAAGLLPRVDLDDDFYLTHADFSCDEQRLAVLYTKAGSSMLAVWDLAKGELLNKVELQFSVFRHVWCGRDHLLLQPLTVPYGGLQPILDIRRGLVVWNFKLEDGLSFWSSPDHRHWYWYRKTSQAQAELIAVALPDDKVVSILSQTKMPDPLIGPGVPLKVETFVEGIPAELPPGWKELAGLNETLYKHFSQQLKAKQVEIKDDAPARLLIGIKSQSAEKGVRIRGPYGRSGSALISATILTPYVVLHDSDGNRVWERQYPDDERELPDLDSLPEGMDPITYANMLQWDAAARWLKTVVVPCPVFHPGWQRGLGESLVKPDGTEIIREPSSARMKTSALSSDTTSRRG